jgi:hypothetical protein
MKKISKNCFKGEAIRDPKDIEVLALEKKSIYFENWGIKPAAIYLSMQFRIVMGLINRGQLFRVTKFDPNSF